MYYHVLLYLFFKVYFLSIASYFLEDTICNHSFAKKSNLHQLFGIHCQETALSGIFEEQISAGCRCGIPSATLKQNMKFKAGSDNKMHAFGFSNP